MRKQPCEEKNIQNTSGEKAQKFKQIWPAVRLAAGGALWAAGLLLSRLLSFETAGQAALWAAYILLGADVAAGAVVGIFHKKGLDEKFLMTVSTLGALALGELSEAAAVMFFYQAGEMLSDYAQERSRGQIKALLAIRPDTARRKTPEGWREVPCEDIAVGETLLILPGERVALDGVVSEGESEMDLSALTGESLPKRVQPGDEVYSGAVNQTGALQIRAQKPFALSTASRMVEMAQSAASRKAPAERFITRFAKGYTPAVVILAVIVAIVPPIFWGNWEQWLHRALTFLVISCPCALVVSVPLTYFVAVGGASRRGILVKGGSSLDALAKTGTAVFDKTGTLTKGEFRVNTVRPAEGVGDRELLALAALAECRSAHPIARSVLAACDPPDEATLSRFTELPGGVEATANGKQILAGSDRLMRSRGISCPAPERGGVTVYIAEDGVYRGLIGISDTVRDDAKAALDGLKKRGITRTVMLTGDGEAQARAVGEALGISEIRAGLLPEQKVQALSEIEKDGAAFFVGDGVNDAPVLAYADVGVAMGGLGADAAIEAADAVLMDDSPLGVLTALDIARRTGRIAKENIGFTLFVKAVFLVLAGLGLTAMSAAVFADVGVMLLAVLNAFRAGRLPKAVVRARSGGAQQSGPGM